MGPTSPPSPRSAPAPAPSAEIAAPLGTEVIHIGPIRRDEVDDLFSAFADAVGAGDGYPHRPPLTRTDFDNTWVHPVTTVVCARTGGQDRRGALLGAYYLKPNFVGRAAHIANAGYLVAVPHRRKGVGRLLVHDSIWRAPLLGFDAIQFNLVFASNPARRLYEELGWRQTGTVPQAVDGEDALVYWRAVP